MPKQQTPEAADWTPTANWARLRQRAALLATLRQFFSARMFLEVETPLLSAETVVDRHIELFRTTLAPDARSPGTGRTLWLQSSPEAGMKRLVAAGGEAIYQITRAFRNAERGTLHNPEFTIVEWYQVGQTMRQGMAMLGELVSTLLDRPDATLVRYADVFQHHVGLEPHTADEDALRSASAGAAAPPLHADDRDTCLQYLFAERVQPHLGHGAPEIVYDFPAGQAALAMVRGAAPPVAERFEIFVEGVELANGYHELRDDATLRIRAQQENAARLAEGRPELPLPERLLAAMQHGLPDCTGVALGFDRLVMLAAGAGSIDEVMPFPVERA